MNKLPRLAIIECLQWILICSLLTIFWIGLEYILDGQIIKQKSDTVLCLYFSWLILEKIRVKREVK